MGSTSCFFVKLKLKQLIGRELGQDHGPVRSVGPLCCHRVVCCEHWIFKPSMGKIIASSLFVRIKASVRISMQDVCRKLARIFQETSWETCGFWWVFIYGCLDFRSFPPNWWREPRLKTTPVLLNDGGRGNGWKFVNKWDAVFRRPSLGVRRVWVEPWVSCKIDCWMCLSPCLRQWIWDSTCLVVDCLFGAFKVFHSMAFWPLYNKNAWMLFGNAVIIHTYTIYVRGYRT